MLESLSFSLFMNINRSCYAKLLVNMTRHTKLLLISNISEILSKTVLFKFGLPKSDLRQLSWPKVKFKDDLPNVFVFTLPLFRGLFRIWVNDKVQWYTSHFTSCFPSYSKVQSYTLLYTIMLM